MFPVGTILPYAGDLSKIPYGWHVCDGTNGTPDLSDRFLEGTTTTPKTFKDAGLPNITGEFSAKGHDSHVFFIPASGAFYGKAMGTGASGASSGGMSEHYWGFDASRCSPIYGASDTVQPKAYTVYYIMRVK